MDRKIVFMHFGRVQVTPIVRGGGNESYFFLHPKMLVFEHHRCDINEIPSSSPLIIFVRDAVPLGYSFLCQYPFPDIFSSIEAFV